VAKFDDQTRKAGWLNEKLGAILLRFEARLVHDLAVVEHITRGISAERSFSIKSGSELGYTFHRDVRKRQIRPAILTLYKAGDHIIVTAESHDGREFTVIHVVVSLEQDNVPKLHRSTPPCWPSASDDMASD
jgi:hypothetical protein